MYTFHTCATMSTPEQVIMDGLQVLLKSIQLDVSSEVGQAQLGGVMVTFGSTWYRGAPKIASQVGYMGLSENRLNP